MISLIYNIAFALQLDEIYTLILWLVCGWTFANNVKKVVRPLAAYCAHFLDCWPTIGFSGYSSALLPSFCQPFTYPVSSHARTHCDPMLRLLATAPSSVRTDGDSLYLVCLPLLT